MQNLVVRSDYFGAGVCHSVAHKHLCLALAGVDSGEETARSAVFLVHDRPCGCFAFDGYKFLAAVELHTVVAHLLDNSSFCFHAVND